MEMKATDLSARLLATENLAVIRARARTASFDIKSRVLTLPMWKEMTPEIEDMLVGHEVGHALYTGEKYMEPIKENPKLMSYLNVLEDVRIEKLIKRKYPGLRKRMNEGYKQLNDRDFFGVKQVQNFDDLLLIDKLNLYFKAGFQCGVQFDADEKVFVARAEKTETVEDVIQLAHDVYAYSKEKLEEKKKQMKESGESEEEEEEFEDEFEDELDGDFGDDFDELDEELENKPAKKTTKPKQNDERGLDEDLESRTERAFKNKLDDLADESTEYHYWKFDEDYFDDVVIGYKKILSETKTADQWSIHDRSLDYRTRYLTDEEMDKYSVQIAKEYEQFKVETARTVNYLVKEFEMKKSAKLYKRAQTAKIGSLDMRKIYAYKIKDDLFKRVTTLPQGKNHGMIMLVDWSGSMDRVIHDTIKQVVNLAMFCQRIQVPYRVYAFTSGYYGRQDGLTPDEFRAEQDKRYNWRKAKSEITDKIINNTDGFNLLELFSDRMSQSEFNNMSKRLLDYRFFWNEGYGLGGTPLNEALVWCYQNLDSFIRNNQIEKTTFITLTDGEGGSLGTYSRNNSLDDTVTQIIDGQYKRIKQKHFIRDEVTQKTYQMHRYSSDQTIMILNMIKDRYDISVVGFHICENRKGELTSFLHASLPNYAGDRYSLIESWRKEFKTQGFASIKNTGRDELFLIPQSSTKIDDGELEIDSEANARSIAKNFGKYLNVKKTSRILLNRFITLVA
jgi:hypothetical protein